MKKVRVFVVEDSPTVRNRLIEVFQADPEMEVVGEASDGKQAIEECMRLRPDVITLDMVLPQLSGLAVTEYVMAYCPTPIVIVSSSTNRGDLFKTYDALKAGAVDVVEKSAEGQSPDVWAAKLVSSVKLASRVKVITHPRARIRGISPIASSVSTRPVGEGQRYQYVAIGVSTGGPQALAAILSSLPANFPLPIFLVMHISSTFSVAFADWLVTQSRVPVFTAVHGRPVPKLGESIVLLAPPGQHMVVRNGRIELTNDPELHSCRPSVDHLFESVSREFGSQAIAVLLTGMGRDGAQGLMAVSRAGGMTIAQDEASSIVFGMPREAIRLGAARQVLSLDQIAPTLIKLSEESAGRP